MGMMELRRGLMAMASGSGAQIESGQFTVSGSKVKTYDITHHLGVVPNFVFIYPLDVSDASTTYMISSQYIVRDCGQADWKAGADTTTRGSAHGVYTGVGYAAGVRAANPRDSLPVTISNVTYAGVFTDEYVRVGGYDNTNGAGWLLGKYGYVIGVLPFTTAEGA